MKAFAMIGAAAFFAMNAPAFGQSADRPGAEDAAPARTAQTASKSSVRDRTIMAETPPPADGDFSFLASVDQKASEEPMDITFNGDEAPDLSISPEVGSGQTEAEGSLAPKPSLEGTPARNPTLQDLTGAGSSSPEEH